MKTHPILLLSGFTAIVAVPVLVNAADQPRNLLLNPTEILNDKGAVVLAAEAAQSVRKTRTNVDKNGVILQGYDPVAYFTRHQALKGNPAIQTSYGGAIYHFISVADKAAFDKNPSKYVPQYGGYCANHLSKGVLSDSDPTAFSVYKGKLYVCADRDSLKEFRGNIDENIRKADEHWITYHYGWHGHPAFLIELRGARR